MTKSELIEKLADKLSHLSAKDVEQSIKEILELMAQSLSKGDRIEIRGFGSFSLHYVLLELVETLKLVNQLS